MRKVNADLRTVLDIPEVKSRLESSATYVRHMSPAETRDGGPGRIGIGVAGAAVYGDVEALLRQFQRNGVADAGAAGGRACVFARFSKGRQKDADQKRDNGDHHE